MNDIGNYMKSISENNISEMPKWLFWFGNLLIGFIMFFFILIKIILPVIDLYQSATLREIAELKNYAAQNQAAEQLFSSTIKLKPILSKSQAKQLKLDLIKHVDPVKYKQFVDEIELKRIEFPFGPIL